MIRLYRFPYSTNVERVALALAHKGLATESVWIDPDDRGGVRGVSRQDLVPVIEHDDRVVSDSTEIIRYLEAVRPDPPLLPAEPARRTEMLIFVDWFNRVWKAAPNGIADELGAASPDRARVARLSREMRGALDLFEALLDGRDHLMGPFSAADCAAFPFLKYAVLHEPEDSELFHLVLRDHQPLGSTHPRLEAWIRRVDERPRA